MDDEEATAVLGPRTAAVDELLASARGWPAIIGLAALTGEPVSGRYTLPSLGEYFSEELLLRLAPRRPSSHPSFGPSDNSDAQGC